MWNPNRTMHARLVELGVALCCACAGSSGCFIFDAPDDEAPSDGDFCTEDDDCSTGVCTTYGLCSHTHCTCPGDACAEDGTTVDACRDGWVCVDKDSIFDPVTEFFGGEASERRGLCQAPCDEGCPEHYSCDLEGVFCRPDTAWADPVPTLRWTGAATGEISGAGAMMEVVVEGGSRIVLEGSATSPADAPIEALTWTVVSPGASEEQLDGDEIEVVVPPASGYSRVELMATDDRQRRSVVTVVFDACLGAGETCGYGGAGCCEECEAVSNTCG